MENLFLEVEKYGPYFGLKIAGAVAIILIGLWIVKQISKVSYKLLGKKDLDPTITKFLVNTLKAILTIFVILAGIGQLGVETASFVAMLAAAGLAIGFALQGSLSNVAAGIMLIAFRQIKVGNFIEGGGVKGTVEQIGIFTTHLITPDNKMIYVPNSKLASDNITNYSAMDTRRVDMVFGISYSDDISKAKATIKSVIDADPRILKEPAPVVVTAELADSSVNIYARPWVNSGDYWGVYFDLTEKVKIAFDDAGISIPFPQTDVHVIQN